MKKFEFSKTDKVLIGIIAGLVLVILFGTIFAKANQKLNTPEVLIQKGKAVSLMAPSDTDEVAYYQLGTIRILTAPEAKNKEKDKANAEGTLMVITPWLSYPAGDTVFYEELVRKNGITKAIFQAYFSEHTKTQILSETEEKIEGLLKEKINSQFALGQISDIYFTDYIFIE